MSSDPDKHGPVDRHGKAIVLNKKWCLRGVAVLSIVIAALSFFFAHRISRVAVAGGIICLILAELTED